MAAAAAAPAPAAAGARLRAARKTHELLSNPGYINHLRALMRTAERDGGGGGGGL